MPHVAYMIFLLNFVLAVLFGTSVGSVIDENVDFPIDTADIAALHGYGAQLHKIKTYDGYSIGIHRLINNNKNFTESKGVVLVMHGLFCSSSSWLLAGKEKSLPYLLSDEGYDVWLGNSRGTRYSLGHEELATDSNEYWDFSWHEMGKYDLPVMIAYVKEQSKVDKVFYIGHSQGTTDYFVMSSLFPQFAKENVQAAVALAPVAYLSNIQSRGFKLLSKFVNTFVLNSIKEYLALHNMSAPYEIFKPVLNKICDDHDKLSHVCDNLLFFVGGYDEEQMDENLIPIIWNHVPEGGSFKQIMHYSQLIKSKKFAMYDDGMVQNLINYGSLSPPNYKLSQSDVKVALFYGLNDWLATPKDVLRLNDDLPNSELFKVNYKNFTHLDFLWANDVKKLVYDDVITYLNNGKHA